MVARISQILNLMRYRFYSLEKMQYFIPTLTTRMRGAAVIRVVVANKISPSETSVKPKKRTINQRYYQLDFMTTSHHS